LAPREPVPVQVQAGETEAALEGYLQTMQQFLLTSEQIMSAYLGLGTEIAGVQAQRPLVGTITSWVPEQELVAQRVVDPTADTYLLHHTLGREVSRTDPELHALALMPLAMSVEILAETASCLLPELVVTGLRDVRARSWLAFPEGARTLEVRARVLARDAAGVSVRVELRTLDGDAAVAEATVLLGEALPPAPAAPGVALEDARPSRLTPQQLYEVMFHQPLWQGVESMDLVGAGCARARLQALPRTGLVRGDPDPALVLDPVLLDAAGQVIGLWAAETLERARVVFPFRVAAIDVYAPPPAPGEQLTCVAAIEREGEQLLSSDIDVLDAGGNCLMRLRGWDDRRFEVPEHLAPLARPDRLGTLCEPLFLPRELDAPLAGRRLDVGGLADRALWIPVWAARVLGRRERQLFAALELPEPRRLEWLAARTAAKECVAELARAAYGIDLLPAEIEILPGERGEPRVAVSALEGLPALPVVSLTHSHGDAAALAALLAPGAGGVGIDIERIVPRREGFALAAFAPEERRLLEQLPPDAEPEWLVRLWCAREAAGKALGSGLGTGAEAPRAVELDPSREVLEVEVGGRRLGVRTRREGDTVIAYALAQRAVEVAR
jgi:phosphopantetheinyl transferase